MVINLLLYALFSEYGDVQPWWYVDLGDQYDINQIIVVNYNDPNHCRSCSKLFYVVSKNHRFEKEITFAVHSLGHSLMTYLGDNCLSMHSIGERGLVAMRAPLQRGQVARMSDLKNFVFPLWEKIWG